MNFFGFITKLWYILVKFALFGLRLNVGIVRIRKTIVDMYCSAGIFFYKLLHDI